MLGFYQYAYRFSNAPATELTQVISSVMFPTFSKFQGDPARLRDAFLKTVRTNAALSIPASVGIALVAPPFVRGFLGEQWVPMIPLMQILALYGGLRAFTRVFGSVWKAVGRPDYITKLSALRVVLLALLIFPVSDAFGVVGTAAVVTGVFVFPMLPLDFYFIVDSVDTTYREILSELYYPLSAAALMGVGVWGIRRFIDIHPIVEFTVLSLAGVVIYGGILAMFETMFDLGFKKNVDTVLNSMRG
jgi:PST family polysaccharide transporter/lipopolysaccharide exporter